jgi:hypothetical protein
MNSLKRRPDDRAAFFRLGDQPEASNPHRKEMPGPFRCQMPSLGFSRGSFRAASAEGSHSPDYALPHASANITPRSISSAGCPGSGCQARMSPTTSGLVSSGRQRSTRRESGSTIQYSGTSAR